MIKKYEFQYPIPYLIICERILKHYNNKIVPYYIIKEVFERNLVRFPKQAKFLSLKQMEIRYKILKKLNNSTNPLYEISEDAVREAKLLSRLIKDN